MAAWRAQTYSRAAVRAFLERVGPRLLLAGFVVGTLFGRLVPAQSRFRYSFELGSALSIAVLLAAWWQIRRGPAEPHDLPVPLDPKDTAHFGARQAERARTLGHP